VPEPRNEPRTARSRMEPELLGRSTLDLLHHTGMIGTRSDGIG
jgi:hypothetical protein